MRTRFTLVRHGETAWNATGRWQGQAHVPLNDEGRRQSVLLARHLAGRERVDLIVSSDLVRACETARVVADLLAAPVALDARLRELDLGEWQGLTGDEVRTWDAERLRAIEDDPYHHPRPGGESPAQCALRAAQAIEELAAKRAGGHTLIVSHGGTIRNLLFHIGLARPGRTVVGNTSCSRLVHELAGGQPRWTLEEFNSIEHLGGNLARVEVEP